MPFSTIKKDTDILLTDEALITASDGWAWGPAGGGTGPEGGWATTCSSSY
jgi:hypothetical protein